MELRSLKIVAGIGAISGMLLLGFFMFFWRKDVPLDDVAGGSLPLTQIEDIHSPQIGFKELFVPVVRPLEPAVSYIEGVFSNETPVTNISTTVLSPNEPRDNKKPLLSEEQIFDTLWPQSYRDALITLQDIMIRDGFMTELEKRSVITSDEQVYATLLTIADYALKQGWVESADFDQLRMGIQELERIIAGERANLRMSGKVSASVLLPGGQRINNTPQVKQDFFSMIIDGLKYSLTAQEANAQIPGVPGWHTTPDCYKDLAPNPLPGVSLWAFCCNCGLLCTPLGCAFIPDCGPFSAFCNVPLGCLNLMCLAWPNAEWDAFWNPLGTGICGCG